LSRKFYFHIKMGWKLQFCPFGKLMHFLQDGT
jgi:hypothetical protein